MSCSSVQQSGQELLIRLVVAAGHQSCNGSALVREASLCLLFTLKAHLLHASGCELRLVSGTAGRTCRWDLLQSLPALVLRAQVQLPAALVAA